MQSRNTIFAVAFIILASFVLIFNSTPQPANRIANAGGVTPTLANYLPIVLNPAGTPTVTPTPTATITPTPTPMATPLPASVQITLIVYNPAGDDVEGEYVRMQNMGGVTQVMTGWTLSDDDGRIYNFPSFSLAPGAAVQVWTKSGANNGANLYWGEALAVWTNTGDVAYLRDGGTLIDSCSYAGGGVQQSC